MRTFLTVAFVSGPSCFSICQHITVKPTLQLHLTMPLFCCCCCWFNDHGVWFLISGNNLQEIMKNHFWRKCFFLIWVSIKEWCKAKQWLNVSDYRWRFSCLTLGTTCGPWLPSVTAIHIKEYNIRLKVYDITEQLCINMQLGGAFHVDPDTSTLILLPTVPTEEHRSWFDNESKIWQELRLNLIQDSWLDLT